MFFPMIEYIVGITKRVKKVENNIPPNIVIPTVSLLAAPGPVPNINGKTPNIVDKLVINIGLNLITEALIIASSIFLPLFLIGLQIQQLEFHFSLKDLLK